MSRSIVFSLQLHINLDNMLDWLTAIFIPTQNIHKQGTKYLQLPS